MLTTVEEDSDSDQTYHQAYMSVTKIWEQQAAELVPIPRSYREAVNDPIYGAQWQEACDNELNALAANGTWEPTVPPRGVSVVTCKWVFAIKYNLDGSIQKLKARVVARGFSQTFGIDYNETFAPTVRMDTLRVFFCLVALEDLNVINRCQ